MAKTSAGAKGGRSILIGNVSGSTGDRLDGLRTMLRGNTKVDGITGDWLSEYNLATRSLQMRNEPNKGYEPGFLQSFRLALDDYLQYPNQNLRIAVNAGGLNPKALADEIQTLLTARGSEKRVAYITGDNLLSKLDSLDIEPLTRSTGGFSTWRQKYPEVVLATAYIGCWGMVQALNEGADVVICGRCTDASPVIGLAAWWHGWTQNCCDRLAGALFAGHLIECGCYVTGGNYAGFETLAPNYHDLSYPIAEIAENGTAVIQKQPGQNGVVNIDTVRGQFVYELQGCYYYNPDVIGDFTNVFVKQIGSSHVQIGGARGLPAPETLKIALMSIGGYQAEFSVYVTGLQAEEKARAFEAMSRRIVDESKFDKLEFQLYGSSKPNPTSQNEATLQLRIFAQAKEAKTLAAGKFLGPMMSNQLQGYPGLTANFDFRTATPKVYCTYFPGLVAQVQSQLQVHFVGPKNIGTKLLSLAGLGGKAPLTVQNVARMTSIRDLPQQKDSPASNTSELSSFGETVQVPLGSVVFSRSGDKGSNVNVGFFFPGTNDSQKKWEWLRNYLSTQKLRDLLATEAKPDVFIERCEFPDLMAVHFVIHGVLGAGVSSSSKMDSLGKNVAEYLKARWVDMPEMFLRSQANL